MNRIDRQPDDAAAGARETIPAEPGKTVDATVFREAMTRLGAAVHVVTTAGPGGKCGFTATAVTSVSDQPATLLVCLNRNSQITPVLQQNRILCVNTLGAHEEAIADVFAGRTGIFMENRFEHGEWTTMKSGCPTLSSAVIAFDCRIVEIKEVASHDVYFCAVDAIRQGPAGPVLVYHERAYKRV